MEQGAVFQSNRGQAIRLPKAVALPDDVKRVDIVAVGRTRIITPAGEVWDSWFEGAAATSDFMSERDQPA
ncbi:antitoxin [Rhizobium sp. Root708]|uniref:type II toxin-antitoxin system VapB family antitoxin n=1 Tax=Rhizobium sp. Root708 TaxID=1736592 RepID=UPI0006F7253F|nr:type II toxin-antitoxin system VapB family antitoxin [Rhizobium sp. Root708]KRB57040.1 antitoxin [Rhizobium sp. Root708]